MTDIDHCSRPSLSSDAKSEAGFTLVEVLVALALVAAISMVMTSMISQLRLVTSALDKSDAVTQAETLAEFIRQTVQSARPLILTQSDRQRPLMMIGSEESISFVGSSRVGAARYGLRDIRIFLDKSTSGRLRLMQTLEARRRDNVGDASIMELALIDELHFQYWGSSGSSLLPLPAWHDSWAEPDQLPLSVRVEFSLVHAGQKVSASRVINLSGAGQ